MLSPDRTLISRLEWWIGVVLVVLAILAHALVPRYDYQHDGPGSIAWVRVDRWTGRALVLTITTDGIMRIEEGKTSALSLSETPRRPLPPAPRP